MVVIAIAALVLAVCAVCVSVLAAVYASLGGEGYAGRRGKGKGSGIERSLAAVNAYRAGAPAWGAGSSTKDKGADL